MFLMAILGVDPAQNQIGANFLVTYRKEEAVSLVLLLWCLVVKVVEQLLMKARYEICHAFIMFGCFCNFST